MRWIILLAVTGSLSAQEWRYWGGDAGGAKYSKLKQIDRGNVARLKVAWTYHTGDIADGKETLSRSAFEATPLMVDGVLYLTTPFNRLITLDADTGRELWAFDPQLDRRRPYNLYIHRGAAWWSDGRQNAFFTERSTGACLPSMRRRAAVLIRSVRGASSTCERVSRTSSPDAATA
jgi:quinoprotein glucose dehydrogenase